MNAKQFMGREENKREQRSHVIEKIRRISVSMDRGESWTWILLVGLFVITLIGLVYYFLF